MNPQLPLLAAGLLLAGFLCQWLAWRVKLPAILFLLLAGIVLGPVTGLVDPDALLGELLFPFVSLGVAVILFEGSLTLRFDEARAHGGAILRLVSLGALVTMGVIAGAAHLLAGLSGSLSLLFGALLCVTGPTVIVPMLRSVRPNERVANVLRWEGILIDPIGALLAVLVYQAVVSELGQTPLQVFGLTVLVGAGAGLAGAGVLALLLRRHFIPEYLQNLGTLALVVTVFTGSNALMHESGLLAVTVMGMTLANVRGLHMEDILDFKEHLSTLLISVLFLLLAARLDPMPWRVAAAGLGILLVAQFVARPLAVLVSTAGSVLSWRERALLAWIAPRGIVAAAVSALFALRLQELGQPGAELLVPLAFLLIIGTVLVQSATAGPVARALGVAEPEARGVLVVGADAVARAIALALRDLKLPVVVADDDWAEVRAARMAGLRTFFGNPVSEYADRHLDLIGIGNLIALTPRRELNSLACVRYRPEFGAGHVFLLRSATAPNARAAEHAPPVAAPWLFADTLSHAVLKERLAGGWTLKTTRLSGAFGMAQFRDTYSDAAVPLFGIDERGRLRFAAVGRHFAPGPGWVLTALVPVMPAYSAAPPALMPAPAA